MTVQLHWQGIAFIVTKDVEHRPVKGDVLIFNGNSHLVDSVVFDLDNPKALPIVLLTEIKKHR